MECPPPLELLPRELIWSLIEQAPEAVAALRLSSSTLRAHVDQYALHGAAIRLVDEVQVNSLGLQACVDVKVEVPRRMASLLELRLRLRCAQAKRILKRRRIDDRIAYYFTVPTFHPILRALSEAAGRHIGRLSLARYGPMPLAEIDFMWREKSFRKLDVELEKANDDDAKYVQNTIVTHKVDHLTWNASEVGDSCDTVAFLSEMAALVRTLYVFRIETLEDIAWAPLIQEMLSKKLDKLHLSTTFDRSISYFEQFDTISTDCATALIEALPKIRKRFHFSTAFTGRLGGIKQQRPFICRIKEPPLIGMKQKTNRMLIISHWSRIDEEIVPERKFDGTSFDAYFS
uniref:F-box domain-containing protein n=1 Tax=Pristionchus pacificus TaxID=54126 RepID=A0A8R1YCK0_PRIPA